MFKVEDYMFQGQLRKYTDLGGYPLFYLTKRDCVLCPLCANEEKAVIVAADANWEDPELYCDECSERIESAYAEDEALA